jgi:uncharacterized protein YegP (UPF0339 family)
MKDAIQFELYESKDGFRWRGKRNGKITSESGEGYKRRVSAEKSLRNMIAAIAEGRYVIRKD